MADTSIVLTREELYEQVWSEPMIRVASRLGLSGRGLGKLCARYQIPVPPRGWWAKKQHGHTVKRIPLPTLKASPGRRTITIHRQPEPPKNTVAPDTPPEIAFESRPENAIIVPQKGGALHPLVAAARRVLADAPQPLRYRPLGFRTAGSLGILVSRAQRTRALRIMNALVKGLAARGYVPARDPKRHALMVTVLGEPLFVLLDEKLKQVKRPMTESERRDFDAEWRRSEPYDLVPTGELRLRIRDEHWEHYVLADRTTAKLEDGLNQFVAKLVAEAFAAKALRARREQERHAQEEADRRRREEELRQAEEQKKIDQWDKWMNAWLRSRQVRAFAAAIERGLAPIEAGSKVEGWLTWAREHADRINPLRKST